MDTQIDQNPSQTPNTLIPLPTFKKSGRCPLEPYHLLFHHKESLVESGAFIKFGVKDGLWMNSNSLTGYENMVKKVLIIKSNHT